MAYFIEGIVSLFRTLWTGNQNQKGAKTPFPIYRKWWNLNIRRKNPHNPRSKKNNKPLVIFHEDLLGTEMTDNCQTSQYEKLANNTNRLSKYVWKK